MFQQAFKATNLEGNVSRWP